MPKPPGIAIRLLRLLVSKEIAEEIEGDISELYYYRCEDQGHAMAAVMCWKDILFSLRNARRRRQSNHRTIQMTYFAKLAYRSLWKQKLFTLINVTGLAVGLATFLVVDQYIRYERSFDQFHTKKDRIHRVHLIHTDGGIEEPTSGSYPAIGPTLAEEFLEVGAYTRLTHKSLSQGVFSNTDKSVQSFEERAFFASEAFFSIFSFPLMQGNPQTALQEPNTIVITESLARKYFPNEDPMGKILVRNNRENYVVTGVAQDPPSNTHLPFDVIMSFKSFEQIRPDVSEEHAWNWWYFYTYIQTDVKTDISSLEEKFPDFISKHLGPEANDWVEMNTQPLKDIHLYSQLQMEPESGGNPISLNILQFLSIFILLLALVNYVNLSTASGLERAKEVGIKKVMGSTRMALSSQFLTESILTCAIALLLAMAMVMLAMPVVNNTLATSLDVWQSPTFWLSAGTLTIVAGILAGMYPALMLSSFQAKEVLRGSFKHSTHGLGLRRILVTIQFILTFGMLSGTFIVLEQLGFMLNQDLNVQLDDIVISKAPILRSDELRQRVEVFKDDLLQRPDISSITITSAVPGIETWSAGGVRKLGDGPENARQLQGLDVDEDYAQVFELDMAAGRFFRRSSPNDRHTLVLSQKAVELLGYESYQDALGARIAMWGDTLSIIGVTENYHHLSLQNTTEPLFFMLTTDWAYMAFKLQNKNSRESLTLIEEVWQKHFPNDPFDFQFLDNSFKQQYQEEQILLKSSTAFTYIALFLSVLGLFGLSYYNLIQQKMAISVRKILGARFSDISMLLSKEYLGTVIVATLIAAPAIYLLYGQWINQFAYHISFKWWFVVLPITLLLIITIGTVGIQLIKTFSTNPVKNLRQE